VEADISLKLSDSSDAILIHVWKLKGDILNNICIEFSCSSLVYLINSRHLGNS